MGCGDSEYVIGYDIGADRAEQSAIKSISPIFGRMEISIKFPKHFFRFARAQTEPIRPILVPFDSSRRGGQSGMVKTGR